MRHFARTERFAVQIFTFIAHVQANKICTLSLAWILPNAFIVGSCAFFWPYQFRLGPLTYTSSPLPRKKIDNKLYNFEHFHQDEVFILFSFLDHALLGHAMDTFTIVDAFECQLKCIGNNSCKSVNVHPDSNNAQRKICELNNKTPHMKPGDFKWKKGSTYYGSVQVS